VATSRAEPGRSRTWYALGIAVTIAVGLASRANAAQLPWWLAKTAGDALYATMMFWIVGWLAPRASTGRVALVAIAVCFAIELAQWIHTPWLDAVRATLPGRLVLGQGFHARDLACYVVGAGLAAAIERAARARVLPDHPGISG